MNGRYKQILNHRKPQLSFEELEAIFDTFTDEEKEEAIRLWESKFETSFFTIFPKRGPRSWKDPNQILSKEPAKRTLWRRLKQKFTLLRIWINKKTNPPIHKWSYRISEWLMEINRSHNPNPMYRHDNYRTTKSIGTYKDEGGKESYYGIGHAPLNPTGPGETLTSEEYQKRIDVLLAATLNEDDPTYDAYHDDGVGDAHW